MSTWETETLSKRLPSSWGKAPLIALLGLGYGDEGKGSLTDFLVRATAARLVVRYNGGPQAAHHVLGRDGLYHCFAQFGAGTLVDHTQTYLAASMFVDPLALVKEERALQGIGIRDAFARLVIDPACVVVTPIHALFNRLQETARGHARHGSCGLGVGEVFQDTQRQDAPLLRMADISDSQHLLHQLGKIQACKIAAAEQIVQAHGKPKSLEKPLSDLKMVTLPSLLVRHYQDFLRHGVVLRDSEFLGQTLQQGGRVIMEGAQGTLLDMEYGFWPYVTPSSTTFAYATRLLEEAGVEQPMLQLGILRAYGARHGAGPFPGESSWLTQQIPDQHNGNSRWQGPMRLGWFDAVAARYALQVVGGVDGLVISNLDRLCGLEQLKICHAYQYQGPEDTELAKDFHYCTQAHQIKIMGLRYPVTPEHRVGRTKVLSACKPSYKYYPIENEPLRPDQKLPRGIAHYLKALETLLGHSADLLSLGPGAWDKIARLSSRK